MNLQGKIVKFNVPESDRHLNNHQETCPAIVLTDWSPKSDVVSEKALNLKILYDASESGYETSATHSSIANKTSSSWELIE